MLEKLPNLSDADLLERIKDDVIQRQFLVTGNISRELYDETAIFVDEIDTYTMDKWVKGTSKLFSSADSRVVLTTPPHVVRDAATTATQKGGGGDVQFGFAEYLTFNVPLLQPVVYLTGTVTLERRNANNNNGLITAYKEKWDQDVSSVYQSFQLFGGDKASLEEKLDQAEAAATAARARE